MSRQRCIATRDTRGVLLLEIQEKRTGHCFWNTGGKGVATLWLSAIHATAKKGCKFSVKVCSKCGDVQSWRLGGEGHLSAQPLSILQSGSKISLTGLKENHFIFAGATHKMNCGYDWINFERTCSRQNSAYSFLNRVTIGRQYFRTGDHMSLPLK